mmetsp:Transcript_14370/g.36348  ORF Transcript_14370/g.36348 Transcript_14370/m.36348 type:complete len:201 (-) Transcript_14370:419-1021(-)
MDRSLTSDQSVLYILLHALHWVTLKHFLTLSSANSSTCPRPGWHPSCFSASICLATKQRAVCTASSTKRGSQDFVWEQTTSEISFTMPSLAEPSPAADDGSYSQSNTLGGRVEASLVLKSSFALSSSGLSSTSLGSLWTTAALLSSGVASSALSGMKVRRNFLNLFDTTDILSCTANAADVATLYLCGTPSLLALLSETF